MLSPASLFSNLRVVGDTKLKETLKLDRVLTETVGATYSTVVDWHSVHLKSHLYHSVHVFFCHL